MKFVALLSGGKDSCYNILKCEKEGHELVCLANLCPPEGAGEEMNSFMYQSAAHGIIPQMAECFGVPLIRRAIIGRAMCQHLDYEVNTQDTDEVEDLYLLLAEIIAKYPEIKGVSCGAILSTLVAKKGGDEDKVMLRLKLLVILFNMLSLAESKFAVICAIFNYALETNQEAEVVPFLDRGEKWAAAWKVDDSKRQQLALAIYKVADKVARSEEDISKGASNGGGLTTGASKNALKFLLSYLKSFPSGANLPDEAIQVTLPILVNSLKGSASSFEQRNALLEGLRGSPAGTNASEPLKSLIALLEIVCTGNQAQYDAFVKGSAGQKAMKEHGLNEADLAGTMRVLNLGALAAAKPRLTYAEISSALSLSSLDEVEMLVVEAIAQGVLEATMDQFDQVITITKSSHSTFGMAQWSELQIRLKALRANVSAVYDEIVKS